MNIKRAALMVVVGLTGLGVGLSAGSDPKESTVQAASVGTDAAGDVSTTTTTAAPAEEEATSSTTAPAPTTTSKPNPTPAAPKPKPTSTTRPAPTTTVPAPTTAPPPTVPPTTAPPTTQTTVPPAPAPQTLSGSGQTVTGAFPITGGLTSFQLSHNGSSNFAVWLLHSGTGKREDLLVNDIGAFSGSTQIGLTAGQYVLDVSADGPWQVVIRQPRHSSGPGVPTTLSGKGMTATTPFQVSKQSLVRFQMRHDGDSNFAIWALDAKGNRKELLVNEIGAFDGSKGVSLPAGVYVLQVEADGNWNISIS